MKFGHIFNIASYLILQKKNIYQKVLRKMRPGNWFQAFFYFQKILCKNESDEACMSI